MSKIIVLAKRRAWETLKARLDRRCPQTNIRSFRKASAANVLRFGAKQTEVIGAVMQAGLKD